MRPPIVRRSSGAPSRGQVAPRTRATCRSPVWLPPRSVRSSIVRPEVPVEAPDLGWGRASRPDAPGRCRPATASRRRAGCRRRPRGSGRAARPSAAPARRQAARGAGPADREGVGPEVVTRRGRAPRRPAAGGRPSAGRRRRRSPRREPDPRRVVPAELEYSSRSIGARPSTSSRPVMPKRSPRVGPSVSSEQQLADAPGAGDRRARAARPQRAGGGAALEVPGVGRVDLARSCGPTARSATWRYCSTSIISGIA